MTWEEIKKEEYKAGFEAGNKAGFEAGNKAGFEAGEMQKQKQNIAGLLTSKIPVSEEISHQIESINDVAMLDELFKVAIKAADIEEFEHCLETILSKN